MKLKGYTLIETIIAMLLLVVCVVGFIEGLNVGMLGTHRARMSNAAMELVRSQLEYIKQQSYIVYINGSPVEWNVSADPPVYEPVDGYRTVSEIPPAMSNSSIAFSINTTKDVEGNEIDPKAMQKVTVSVVYDNGLRDMELEGYKSPRLSEVIGFEGRGWLITEIIDNIPELPAIIIGTNWYGYYYTFDIGQNTGEPGPVSISWTFDTNPRRSFFNIADLYLYEYNESTAEFFGEGSKRIRIRESDLPPHLVHAESIMGGSRHMAAIEGRDLPPGTYTAFFYNSGFWFFSFVDILPSTGTITYFK